MRDCDQDGGLSLAEAPRCAECERRARAVSSIADNDLLERAVRNAKSLEPVLEPVFPVQRWIAVKRMFGLGSTYAVQLCRRFGLDPDEMVRR